MAQRRRFAPWPLDEIVMSPLNVSAVMRDAPPPMENVNRLAFWDPMPCSPGFSVMGNALSISPLHVDTEIWALASRCPEHNDQMRR